MLPSGSLRVAVSSVSTTGELDDRLTVPASSTLVTVTVTSRLAVVAGGPAEVATTVTL